MYTLILQRQLLQKERSKYSLTSFTAITLILELSKQLNFTFMSFKFKLKGNNQNRPEGY